MADMAEPLLLLHRLEPGTQRDDSLPGPPDAPVLALGASERQRLRGHFRTRCGRDLVLQLPRGEALRPGEWLADRQGRARVRVEAAAEELLVACSDDPLTLLRAAYHLGNRHVALEVHPGELRLLADPVLAALLRGLGLHLEPRIAPFQPERGAYGGGHHHDHPGETGHSHSHGADHSHDHSHGPGALSGQAAAAGGAPGHSHTRGGADNQRTGDELHTAATARRSPATAATLTEPDGQAASPVRRSDPPQPPS